LNTFCDHKKITYPTEIYNLYEEHRAAADSNLILRFISILKFESVSF